MNADCLARLSPRARRMLELATWRDEPRDSESVIRLLESKGIEPTGALIDLQCCFGGLNYHIRQAKNKGWEFGLSSCYVDRKQEKNYLRRSLNHQSHQVFYAVDETGVIYLGNDNDDEENKLSWHPCASSLRHLIETDALIDELSYLWDTCVFTSLNTFIEASELEVCLKTFNPSFSQVLEASDKYINCWINEDFRVEFYKTKHFAHDSQNYVRIYAPKQELIRQLMAHLLQKGVTPHREIYIYPYPKISPLVYKGFP